MPPRNNRSAKPQQPAEEVEVQEEEAPKDAEPEAAVEEPKVEEEVPVPSPPPSPLNRLAVKQSLAARGAGTRRPDNPQVKAVVSALVAEVNVALHAAGLGVAVSEQAVLERVRNAGH